MTLTQVVTELKKKMRAKNISSAVVKNRIINEIKKDLILPHFLDQKKLSVRVFTSEDEIEVYVGPRDWSFSNKGVFYGAGTRLN